MITLAAGFGSGGIIRHTLTDDLAHQIHLPVVSGVNSHEYWMQRALQCAMQSIGITSPNPAVGCVIVKNNQLIAQGATESYGNRHAERVAIESVSDRSLLQGATIYITLEPCSHFGKQPPCVHLVKSCGFEKCVIGIADPNPLVNGNGIRLLQASGVDVITGVLENELLAWHTPFLLSQLLQRTIFIGKWAQTLDGQLAYDNGQSKWISGDESRAYTHWLRQKYDAIMVGAGTAIADKPSLTVRNCALPHNRHPVRVIFDPRGRIFQSFTSISDDFYKNTFSNLAPVLLIIEQTVLDQVDTVIVQQIQKLSHVHILPMPAAVEPTTWLAEVLASQQVTAMVGRCIQSVMIEGGPRLLSLFFKNAMIDIAHTFTAPTIGGGRENRLEIPAEYGRGWRMYPFAYNRLGEDIAVEYLSQSSIEKLQTICLQNVTRKLILS
ncbi:bifunctional diaminohydroxyphosphoribosylaminopyrimidine deaminase/5-amino-6-(5-phosphoribosylamino)uracil reductase RibD [Nostoc sp. MS1]|uniref:bifunctional diaminohydroxyphosphoribosylaminopyrimidine deaminase/5-amino-6-(5-phosphoribosylamino)uracil reductase RibD n=1 Tax=Nostoc sp. MS1 TaxID=2764711 RepID=UPI001CC6A66F|nr:bifunctional diaminohydroxyphosphoribosylaminopyrimidine deaminase/5-amino-6-(5-phosphoribosylamino)uracil reductase RibD [Nostoc sp. MS1]BCL39338.1 riboflavin biosynthesis protein RibD [Nostoc sp. MS1]